MHYNIRTLNERNSLKRQSLDWSAVLNELPKQELEKCFENNKLIFIIVFIEKQKFGLFLDDACICIYIVVLQLLCALCCYVLRSRCASAYDLAENTCRSDQFRCNDGTCIQFQYKCDEVPDCPDHSDEVDCEGTTTQGAYTLTLMSFTVTCYMYLLYTVVRYHCFQCYSFCLPTVVTL